MSQFFNSLEQDLTIKCLTEFTSIEFLIGVAVHVFDWAVTFQRLLQQRESFWFNSLLEKANVFSPYYHMYKQDVNQTHWSLEIEYYNQIPFNIGNTHLD